MSHAVTSHAVTSAGVTSAGVTSAAVTSPARLWRRVRGRVEHALLAPRYGAIVGVDTEEPVVALTFDDGPHPEVTPRLIDLFARYDAKATHFLVGAAARAHPDLVEALLRAGHTVANHTHDHPSLVRLARAKRRAELTTCQEALGERGARLMRPPYGHYDLACARDVRALGLRCVMWSAHVEDWRPATADALVERIRKALRPGAIVLLHEALYTTVDPEADDRGPLLAAIERTLAESAGKMRFVTVPELLTHGRPRLRVIRRRGEDAFVEAQRPGMRSPAGSRGGV